MPSFGRRHEPDERDHGFLLRTVLESGPLPPLPMRKTWRIAPAALNQGRTGTCVGHGWRNFLRCEPLRTEHGGPSPFDIYRAAVLRDSFLENDDESALPDGDPGMDFGTTVRAGAKALEALGLLASYAWAFEIQTALEWVLTRGPLVLGTNWYESMMHPDPEGIVAVAGSLVGGHCWLLRGIDQKKELARCCNSWGDEWGISGEFYLQLDDLDRLIHEHGECCSAVEKRAA